MILQLKKFSDIKVLIDRIFTLSSNSLSLKYTVKSEKPRVPSQNVYPGDRKYVEKT